MCEAASIGRQDQKRRSLLLITHCTLQVGRPVSMGAAPSRGSAGATGTPANRGDASRSGQQQGQQQQQQQVTYLTTEQIQALMMGGHRPDLFGASSVHPGMLPPLPPPR